MGGRYVLSLFLSASPRLSGCLNRRFLGRMRPNQEMGVKLRGGNENRSATWEAVSDRRSRVCCFQFKSLAQPALVAPRSAPPTFFNLTPLVFTRLGGDNYVGRSTHITQRFRGILYGIPA